MRSRDSGLMTAAEVAAELREGVWSITKKCRSGELRASKPGKAWLISREDLQAYLDAHANRPADESVA